MKRFSALVACAVFWAGCVNATEEAAQADRAFESYKATLPEPNADYGSYPKQYQKLIKSYMNETLKDPESAKYSSFSKPRKEHAIENRKAIYGYASCVLVNAKNSYGGYTGNQQFWFFYRNDKIVRVQNVSTGVDIIYMGHPINCQND